MNFAAEFAVKNAMKQIRRSNVNSKRFFDCLDYRIEVEKMKKVLSFILCITMILSLSSVTFAEHYSKFTDVKPDSWYYEDVDNAVRLGIINGKSETTYCPNDNLTYAEAYKLAACMHQLSVNGKVTLKNSDPWYAEYVEYCCINGIYGSYEDLSEDIDMNQKITRSGYMGIFANALPDDRLPVINYIPDGAIPDVSSQAKFAPGVYKLYRAGILRVLTMLITVNRMITSKEAKLRRFSAE